jgi:hypothetical protein
VVFPFGHTDIFDLIVRGIYDDWWVRYAVDEMSGDFRSVDGSVHGTVPNHLVSV